MKVRFTRWYNAVLTALLSLLGFEACESEGLMEYGTPHADFIVKGVVTDEANHPIEGIRAQFLNDYNWGAISTTTDASGNYEVKATTFSDLYDCKLVVEDIDGEAKGGEFQNDTIDLSKSRPVQVKKGDGSWYQGTYELSQDIKLKKK